MLPGCNLNHYELATSQSKNLYDVHVTPLQCLSLLMRSIQMNVYIKQDLRAAVVGLNYFREMLQKTSDPYSWVIVD